MATQLPQFMQQRLARKTSDITRLTDQYKNQVNAMTGEYEQSFAQYNAKRTEIMAPYEAAVGQYQQQFTGYETALAGYKQRMSEYQAKLQEAIDNPLEEIGKDKYKVINNFRAGARITLDGRTMRPDELPNGYTYENGKLFKARDPGKFEEKAPTAPEAPTAPTVEAFDTTQFDTKRAELDTGLKRELGERKAAKVNAVGRKQARPLLQGAAT